MATAVDLFEHDERVAIVMADISLDYLRPAVEHDPRRAVNAGIMEQSAVGIAAGFALEGFHPIVHTLAPFLSERPLEQIKLDFGYQGLGGTFISAGARVRLRRVGRHAPRAGDIQALGSIPGLEVLVPGSAAETDALLRASYANGRPTYLRTSVVENREPVELAPGGLTVVRRGADVTVVAAGPFLVAHPRCARRHRRDRAIRDDARAARRGHACARGVVEGRSGRARVRRNLRRAGLGCALAPADAAALDRCPAAVHRALRDERRARRRARARRARDPRADPELLYEVSDTAASPACQLAQRRA